MKYLILIISLLIMGCKESNTLKLKYNQKVTVNDDFYGKGECLAKKRHYENIYLFICYYKNGFVSEMYYYDNEVTIDEN